MYICNDAFKFSFLFFFAEFIIQIESQQQLMKEKKIFLKFIHYIFRTADQLVVKCSKQKTDAYVTKTERKKRSFCDFEHVNSKYDLEERPSSNTTKILRWSMNRHRKIGISLVDSFIKILMYLNGKSALHVYLDSNNRVLDCIKQKSGFSKGCFVCMVFLS